MYLDQEKMFCDSEFGHQVARNWKKKTRMEQIEKDIVLNQIKETLKGPISFDSLSNNNNYEPTQEDVELIFQKMFEKATNFISNKDSAKNLQIEMEKQELLEKCVNEVILEKQIGEEKNYSYLNTENNYSGIDNNTSFKNSSDLFSL